MSSAELTAFPCGHLTGERGVRGTELHFSAGEEIAARLDPPRRHS